MDGGSDASATEAMIWATLMAEKAWENTMLFEGWQSTLDDVVVKPSLHGADREREGWSSRRRDNSQKEDKVIHEHMNRYNKSRNPVKTTSPPSAIKLENIHLTERIESLQGLALVGRWHFSGNGRCRDEKMASGSVETSDRIYSHYL